MTEPSTAQTAQPPPAIEPGAGPHETVWQRLQRHKVLQWTLAYAAAAYTVLHATQMVAESFDWPHLIVRIVTLVLALGVPIVVLLAWYHGHKAQHRFSTAELSLLTVLLIIAGSILWAMTRTSVSRTAATGPESPRTSIAVMPFTNMTGDPSKDYLGDGMAEQVIDILTKVPGLKVPARTSSFAYKGRNVDIRQIAKDLGVGAVLEGSVRSAGQRIRITAQLIDARDGLHLWSDTYDQKFTDIFALQDDLATAIVNELRGTVGAATPVVATRPTQNVEAYQLYMQARTLGSISTSSTLHRGIELLDQAIALDPTYADAWASRGGMRAGLVAFFGASPGELEEAERDARQAETLRPNSGLTALAFIHDLLGRWVEAEREYQTALASVYRTEPIAHVSYSVHLGATGRLRAALVQATEAYRLAPADLISISQVANANWMLGGETEALKFADLLTELGDPAHGANNIYAIVALRRGHLADASDRLISTLTETERAAGGAEVVKLVVLALADPAKAPEARKALEGFTRRLPGGGSLSPWVLQWYTQLGALDEVYGIANSSLSVAPMALAWTPEMRPFRRDPRFQQLVTRLGLIEYWKQYGPPDDCDLHGDVLVCR